MSRNQAMTAPAQADQIIGTVGIVRILPALPWSEMMHLQAASADCVAARTHATLQGNRCQAPLSPIAVMEEIGISVPIVRQRADLFPSMRVQTTPRTKPHTTVVFLTDAQNPWLQLKSLSAFFARQLNTRYPFRIRLAAILAGLERSRIRYRRRACGEQMRQFREGQTAPRTVFLSLQQTSFHEHQPTAPLTRALHTAKFHGPSISYWVNWN